MTALRAESGQFLWLDLTLAQTTLAHGCLGPYIRANFSLGPISFWPKSHFGQSDFDPGQFGPWTLGPKDILAHAHYGPSTFGPMDVMPMDLRAPNSIMV